MMEARGQRHLVICSAPFWGHLRGLMTFGVSLLPLDPSLFISFFVHGTYEAKSQELLSSFDLPNDQLSRLHVIAVGSPNPSSPDPMIPLVEVSQITISEYFDKLAKGEAIGRFEPLPPPTCIVCDFFTHHIVDHARAVGFKTNTFIFCTMTPANLVLKNAQLKAPTDDALLQIEGLPPLYKYEMSPATTLIPREAILGAETAGDASQFSGHGSLSIWSRVFHPHSLPTAQKALGGSGGKVMVVEPQYREDFWQPASSFPSTDPLFAWLHEQKRQSVVFVTFGTLFFPAIHPWQVDVLVDALIASGMKFIFSMAAAQSAVLGPEKINEIKNKVDKAGSKTAGWIDQLLLVRHEAIGWILSHGGANTLLESLIHGIPLIIWPIGADQAPNAAYHAVTADVAFELLEVRDLVVGKPLANYPGYNVQCTPHSLRKELDTVLQAAQGDIGARKRANAQTIAQMLRKEHQEKGQSYAKEFLALV